MPEKPNPPHAAAGLDRELGVRCEEVGAERVVLSCEVTPRMHQPHGIVHGGVLCTLVESAASIAAASWYGERGRVVGVSNHTNFLRPVRDGRLTAAATPLQRGRTQQLWQVAVTDTDGRLVAHGQVRLANLPGS